MDLNDVFAKTPKGVIEIKTRSAALTPAMRRVLIMADGKRPLADLVPFVQPQDVETLASALREQGMITLADGSDAVAPAEAEDENQVPVLAAVNAETTNAPRPAVLRLALPASFVERPGAGPPTLRDTIDGFPLGHVLAVAAAPHAAVKSDALDTATRATRATLAARAGSATARSPSASVETQYEVRAEFSEHAPEDVNVAGTPLWNAMASGATNGAGGGVALGAQAAATAATRDATGVAFTIASAAVNGNINSATSGFSAATVRGNAQKPTNSSGPPAPADTLLEESKRLAVRALYERLGPYGEEPAAKMQECRSLEALHEQVQQAVRRIAVFRGERAAHEYLLMLAQP